MTYNEQRQYQKKDFVPIFGLSRYFERNIEKDEKFATKAAILAAYNFAIFSIGSTIGFILGTSGLEKLFK